MILFLKLGSFHLRWWDESMFAVNTYEMGENGKFFSLYFDGRPDLCNTKPPITSWLQLLFAKLLGYTELAIRLPSAIASTITVFATFTFLKRKLDEMFAWIAALILLSSFGFIGFHTSRTGDSDALLTMFLTLANIRFIRFLIEKEARLLFGFVMLLSFAFATKLFAALLFVPAYVILLVYFKQFGTALRSKYTLAGILIFLSMATGLLMSRELDAPGYLAEVLFKDAGRIARVVENHMEAISFYIQNFSELRFSYWFIPAILGIVIIVAMRKSLQHRELLLSSVILSLGYLLVISLSITKLAWYDMPLYPWLAILAAIPIYRIIRKLLNVERLDRKAVMILVVLFSFPLYRAFTNSQDNTISEGEKMLEAKEMWIFKHYKQRQFPEPLVVLHNQWTGSLLFYKYKLRENGQTMILLNSISELKSGDHVLVSDPQLKSDLQNAYELKRIETDDKGRAELFLIGDPKTP